MPNADVTHVGQQDGNSDLFSNFITAITNEVLIAFENACVFRDFGYKRTITEGKEARFDVLGKATARYREKGENLMESGQQIPVDHFIIGLDGPLIANVVIDEWDEFYNHFEVRSRFSKQLGLSLANKYDINKAACGIRGARALARIPGGDGGTVITDSTFASSATNLAKGLYMARQRMNEKNVPMTGRKAFLRPEHMSTLAQELNLINSLYGGTGSVREGDIIKIAGFTLVETNNLPNTNITTDKPKYNGDFSKTICLCATEEAIGTVERKGVTVTATRVEHYKSSLLDATYLVGHDYLRPECAVELATA